MILLLQHQTSYFQILARINLMWNHCLPMFFSFWLIWVFESRNFVIFEMVMPLPRSTIKKKVEVGLILRNSLCHTHRRATLNGWTSPLMYSTWWLWFSWRPQQTLKPKDEKQLDLAWPSLVTYFVKLSQMPSAMLVYLLFNPG